MPRDDHCCVVESNVKAQFELNLVINVDNGTSSIYMIFTLLEWSSNSNEISQIHLSSNVWETWKNLKLFKCNFSFFISLSWMRSSQFSHMWLESWNLKHLSHNKVRGNWWKWKSFYNNFLLSCSHLPSSEMRNYKFQSSWLTESSALETRRVNKGFLIANWDYKCLKLSTRKKHTQVHNKFRRDFFFTFCYWHWNSLPCRCRVEKASTAVLFHASRFWPPQTLPSSSLVGLTTSLFVSHLTL